VPDDDASASPIQRLRSSGPIALVLVGSFVLYVWNLAINQWANSFYTAAIWSGSRNFEAAFYGSLDPSNAMSVDKPPAAFWLPEILVRIFGLHSWTVILPNALLGSATVGLVYLIARRVAGEKAALFGAVVTALTPVSALMFRYNNPDALLVFLLVAAGYATIRATEVGGRKWLATAGLLVGFAILTKMLQAGLVVPAFAAVYLLAAPGVITRRIIDLLWAAGGILIGCGWWFAIVALTPSADRPFIDGTTNNSIFDLVFGYNGFGRLTGSDGNQGGSSGGGALRLLQHDALPMVSWLIPAAAVLGVVAVARTWRRPREDGQRITLLIAVGSLLISALFFSFMGGIYHDYYSLALVPWIGLTVAVAVPLAGRRAVAAALAVSAVWEWHVLHEATGTLRAIGLLVLIAGLGLAAVLVIARGRLVTIAIVAAAIVTQAGPAAYALRVPNHAYMGAKPVITPAVGMDAGLQSDAERTTTHCPKVFGGMALPVPGYGQSPTIPDVVAQVLRSDTGSRPWTAATIGSERAGAYELASGKSVMAIGGYKIRTPGITLERFQDLVRTGQVRYFMPVCVWPIDQTSYLISVWVWQHYSPNVVAGIPVIDFEKPRPTAS
jgi:4-amino-4-deoxy-L-arabinose transferase-like glycosyltransferase